MGAEWGTMQAEYFPGRKSNEGPILIVRSGAIGDLLLLSPAIAALRDKYPARAIFLCCRKELREIMNAIPTIEYPLSVEDAFTFPTIITLEEVMELQPDVHATDAFAERLSVTVTDYKPLYFVTDQEKEIAKTRFKSDRPKVAVQPISSSKNRNYPIMKWAEIILKLQADGWEVAILGGKNQVPKFQDTIHQEFIQNFSITGLTFRQSAAVLSVCDAFVGVDSAFVHLCHALDIPAVGLYGPFKWQSRTAKAPKTFALSGEGECKGCSWHTRMYMQFPPNKPCTQKQECVVLSSIEVDRVVREVNKLKP